MTTLDGTEIVALVFVVVLSIVVVALLLYLIRRLRKRRVKILNELDDRPELNQDRAYNRLAMARREAAVLAGQGMDVHRARELIAESQGAFDTRQYDRAYRVAQSAHEALVIARSHGSMPPSSTTPSPNSALPSAASVSPTASTTPSSPDARPPVAPAIPKNRAESQFQIRILGDEIAARQGRRARDPAVVDATKMRTQASSAFDRGDFTEAFRLGLKGRRMLGATVESLPAVGGGSTGGPAGPYGGRSGAPDATATAEAVAGGERCPDCGYPALRGDVFCRGCGRPRTVMSCASCGSPRVGNEGYCGRCGARFV